MPPNVMAVKALLNYQLEAQFADSEVRRFDMLLYLDYPVFLQLHEESLFLQVRILNGTVEWSDEIDILPDALYLKGDRQYHAPTTPDIQTPWVF